MLDKHPPIKTEKQIKNYLYLEYFKKLGNIHPTATARQPVQIMLTSPIF